MSSASLLHLLFVQSMVGLIVFFVLFMNYVFLAKMTSISTSSSPWLLLFISMVVPSSVFWKLIPQKDMLQARTISLIEYSPFGPQLPLLPSRPIFQLSDFVLAVWLLGVFVALSLFVIRPLVRQRGFLRKLKNGRSIDRVKLECLERSPVFYKQQSVVLFEESQMATTPFVIGFLSPQLYVPVSFLEKHSKDAIKGILFHEEAHAYNYDNLKNLFSRCVLSLFWFLPFVYVALYYLRQTQEVAADYFALKRLNSTERVQFAQTMVATALSTEASNYLFFKTAFNEENHITRRLNMIKKFKPRNRFSTLLSIVVMGGAFLIAYASMAEDQSTMLKISGTISSNGKVSAPTIIVRSGEIAKIVQAAKGDKKRIIEVKATYFEPKSASVEIVFCEEGYDEEPMVDASEETCREESYNIQFSGPLGIPHHAKLGNINFDFDVSKIN